MPDAERGEVRRSG